ncbi:hypothetical protein BUALT_Bualt18G0115200 [Buddleja alternifolia]|uniref:Uncharacterized protein n=1 Tax=Buddleja alternifolia TaxID=168488 RepID=A0AAV6WEU0_9LAMI|nr:hypothetical protein BUALT_Bualt18G0115200 [Buddleja alternifolia]
MASLTQTRILFIAALSFVSLAGTANSSAPQFYVEGEVYCEVCRTDFINKFSELMPGAKVKLECKGEGEGNITYSIEGETNEKGLYNLAVEGDHEDEECEITLVKSSRPDCDEVPDEGFAVTPNSRITLTQHNGVHGITRHANPLAFAKKEFAPPCAEFLKQIAVDSDDD